MRAARRVVGEGARKGRGRGTKFWKSAGKKTALARMQMLDLQLGASVAPACAVRCCDAPELGASSL